MMDVLISLVVFHVGVNKFYRDQLVCREQEPWLFRGGLLGEIQVLSCSSAVCYCQSLIASLHFCIFYHFLCKVLC